MRSGAKRNELATKKVCDADVDLSIHTMSNIISVIFLMESFHKFFMKCCFGSLKEKMLRNEETGVIFFEVRNLRIKK